MAINIGSRLEPFWDDTLVDMQKTTAVFRLNHPVRREVSVWLNAPWDGDSCSYKSIIKCGNLYRMYYVSNHSWHYGGKTRPDYVNSVCAVESTDGVHWYKPNYGIVNFHGTKDNNIILTADMLPERRPSGINIILDNFFIEEDTNPAPIIPYKYKAITSGQVRSESGELHDALFAYGTDDGLHFTYIGLVTEKGSFDTLNTFHYNRESMCYVAYIRGYHTRNPEHIIDNAEAFIDDHVRDIRRITSPDFIHWSEPEMLDYGDAEEFQLYTNNIQPYYRAPHIFIGIPTRYVERRTWTPGFDRLGGAEERKKRTALDRREGTVVTEALFMCSHDGLHFKRYDEAFMRPEPESGSNWLYGDMFCAHQILETPSGFLGEDNEMSIFVGDGEKMPTNSAETIVRYTIRKDGFVSLHADAKRSYIVTKPFIFDGSTLTMNFATSARGYLYITLKDMDTGKELHSYEVFGNKTDRIIDFDGNVGDFSGHDVVMEIVMYDADVYAFAFR